MKRLSIHAVALAGAISLAACGPADDTTRMTETPEPGVGMTGEQPAIAQQETRDFVQHAAEKNMAEIELGRLAQERASDPQVRQFAERMVEEHTKALDELRQIAQRENIQIAEQVGDEGRQVQERLQDLKGPEFDREYMSAMIDAHEEMQNLVQDRAHRAGDRPEADVADDRQPVGTVGQEPGLGIDQELNQWAARKLPVIERHHQQAENIQQQLGKQGAATR